MWSSAGCAVTCMPANRSCVVVSARWQVVLDGCRYCCRAPAAMEAKRQGLTLVPNSAQLELTLPLSAPLELHLSHIQPRLTSGCVPKLRKLSSNVSDVSRRSSS
jgi:hypothetical protein